MSLKSFHNFHLILHLLTHTLNNCYYLIQEVDKKNDSIFVDDDDNNSDQSNQNKQDDRALKLNRFEKVDVTNNIIE